MSIEPISRYDQWKLDNGPYENDGDPSQHVADHWTCRDCRLPCHLTIMSHVGSYDPTECPCNMNDAHWQRDPDDDDRT